MNKLSGKRALVTAGAQGIGLAISRQLLAAGLRRVRSLSQQRGGRPRIGG